MEITEALKKKKTITFTEKPHDFFLSFSSKLHQLRLEY